MHWTVVPLKPQLHLYRTGNGYSYRIQKTKLKFVVLMPMANSLLDETCYIFTIANNLAVELALRKLETGRLKTSLFGAASYRNK